VRDNKNLLDENDLITALDSGSLDSPTKNQDNLSLGAGIFGEMEAAELKSYRPEAETIDYSLDFGSSKTDKNITNYLDLQDLGNSRGGKQSSLDKIANGSVNFVTSVVGHTAGGLVGLTAGAMQGIYNEIGGDGENSVRYLYDNAVFNVLDSFEDATKKTFPMYYSNAEREKGLMGQMGTLNFWANDFANGLSFITSAVLTEMAATALTGGLGTAAASVRNAALASRMFSKANSTAGALNRAGRMASRLSEVAAMSSKTKSLLAETGTVGRQVWTGAGYEASVEARQSYDSTVDAFLSAHYEDKINEEELRRGENLSREQKLELLTPEERTNLDNEATGLSNSVFAGNLALVGLGNMITLGHLYSPKMLQRMSRPIGDKISAKLGSMGVSKGARAIGMGTASWAGRAAWEGLVEEGGQGSMQRMAQNFAEMSVIGKEGSIGYIQNNIDAMEDAMRDTYGTTEGMKEVLIGSLAAALGLPGATGFAMSRDINNEEDRIKFLDQKKKLSKRMADWEKIKEKNPDLKNMDQRAYMMSLMSAAGPAISKAYEEKDIKLAKDLETDVLIADVLLRSDMEALGSLEDLQKTIDNASTEEFKKWFRYDKDMTEAQVKERVAEVQKRTGETIQRILKAKSKVDRLLPMTENEKLSRNPPSESNGDYKGWMRTQLIRHAATVDISEKRLDEMTADLGKIMGAKVNDLSDTYNSLTFTDKEGEKITINLTEQSPYNSVAKNLEDAKEYLAQIERDPFAYNESKQEVEKKISDHKAFIAKMEEVNDKDTSILGIFPENGAEYDKDLLQDWVDRSPDDAAVNMDDAVKLLMDIRRVSASMHDASRLFNSLQNPEYLKTYIAGLVKIQGEIKAEDDALEAQTNEGKEKQEKKASKWIELKNQIKKYKYDLTENQKEAEEHIEEFEAEVDWIKELITGMKPLVERAKKNLNQNKFLVDGVNGKKKFITREELMKQFNYLETEIAVVKKKVFDLKKQAALTEQFLKTELAVMEGILAAGEEIVEDDFTDVRTMVIEKAKQEGISEEEAFQKLMVDLSVEVKNVSDFIENEGLEERISIVEEMIATLKRFLEDFPDVNVIDRKGRWKFVDGDTDGTQTILGMETALKELQAKLQEQEIKRDNAERSRVRLLFMTTLDRIKNFVPTRVGDFVDTDSLEEDIDNPVKLTTEQRNLIKPDVNKGLNKTGGSHVTYALDEGGTVGGSMQIYKSLSEVKDRNDEQNRELAYHKSRLVWFNYLNSEGTQVVHKNRFRGEKTVMVYVHQGNVPKVLKNEMKDMFFNQIYTEETAKKKDLKYNRTTPLKDIPSDHRDIKGVLAKIGKKNGKTTLTFVKDKNNRYVFTSLVEPFYLNEQGVARYSNSSDIPMSPVEIKREENKMRAFRDEILKNTDLQMSEVNGKAQGTINLMSLQEIEEQGLSFAEDAVMGSKGLPNVSIKTANPLKGKNVASVQTLVWGKHELTLRPGQVGAYDHVRQVAIPMRKAFLNQDLATKVTLLYKKMLTEYAGHIAAGSAKGEAVSLAASTLLEAKGLNNPPKINEQIQDLVYTHGLEGSKFTLKYQLVKGGFGVVYGLDSTELNLEDFDNEEKMEAFNSFLLNKYHNVNSSTLIGTTAYKNSKYTSLKKGWALIDLNDDLTVKGFKSYSGYNEYLLQKKTDKNGSYAPLRTAARSIKGTILGKDFENYDRPRVYGAYTRVDLDGLSNTPFRFLKQDEPGEDIPGSGYSESESEFDSYDAVAEEAKASEEVNDEANEAAQEIKIQEEINESVEFVDIAPDAETGTTMDSMVEDADLTDEEIEAWSEANHVSITIEQMAALRAIEAKRKVDEARLAELEQKEKEREDNVFNEEEDDGDLPSLDLLQNEEVSATEDEVLEQIAQALKMRKLDVKMVQGTMKSKDGESIGRLVEQGKVLLSSLAPGGTVFHEAYHDFSIYGISIKDRKRIYGKVKKMKGKTTTYLGKDKLFSELTDLEAEEWLAEGFRHKMIYGNTDEYMTEASPEEKTFFNKIIDFIKNMMRRLLNLDNSFGVNIESESISDIFENLAQGKYVKLDARNKPAGPYDMLTKIPEKDNKFTRGMVRSMSAYIGKRMYKPWKYGGKPQAPVTHSVIYNKKGSEARTTIVRAFYKTVIRDMYRDLALRKDDLTKSGENAEELERVTEAYDYIKNNPKTVLGTMDKLQSLFLTNQAESLEDNYYENEMETEKFQRDFVDERDALEESAVTESPLLVRMMLSTIQSKENTSIGLPDVYNMPKLLITLYNELAGKMTIDAQLDQLESIKGIKGNEWVQTVIDMVDLNPEKERFENLERMTAFRSTFAKANLDIALQKIAEDGTVYLLDPAEISRMKKIQIKWGSILKANAGKRRYGYVNNNDKGQIVFDVEKDFTYMKRSQVPGEKGETATIKLKFLSRQIEKFRNIPDTIGYLKLIGIEFSDEAKLTSMLQEDEELEAQFFEDATTIFADIAQAENPLATLFNKENTNAVTRVNNMIKLEMSTDAAIEHGYLNAKNKQSYSVVQPNHLSTIPGLGYVALAKYYNPKTSPYITHSRAVQGWKEGELDFKVVSMAGLGSDTGDSRGKMFVDMNEADIMTSHIDAYLRGISIPIRMGNKKTEYGVKLPMKYVDTVNEMLPILRDYLYDEVAESAVNGVNGKEVSKYKDKIQSLRLLAGLLSEDVDEKAGILKDIAELMFNSEFQGKVREEIAKDGISPSLIESISGLTAELDAAFTAGIERDVQEMDDYLTKNKLITENVGAGSRRVQGISPHHFGTEKDTTMHNDAEIKKLLTKVVVRQLMGKHEMFKMYFRDPAFFSDLFKRMAMASSTKTPLDTSDRMMKYFSQGTKTQDGTKFLNENLHINIEEGTFSGAVLEEPIAQLGESLMQVYRQSLSKKQLKNLADKGVEYADGSYYVSLPTYRFFSILTDDWGIKKEELYWKLIEDKEGTGNFDYNKGATFQSGKYLFFGPTTIEVGKDEIFQGLGALKMSMIPIYNQLGHVGGKKYPNILKMVKFMDDQKVSSLVLPSGMKLGAPTARTQFMSTDKNGLKTMDFSKGGLNAVAPEGSIVNFDMNFMGRQMPVAGDPKNTVSTAVQYKTQVLANTHRNGVARPGYKETVDTYNSVIETLTGKYLQKALVKYGINEEFDDKGNTKFVFTEASYGKILKDLEAEGLRVGIGAALMDTVKYLSDKGGEFVLENFVDRYRIEAMHYSAFSKSVVKPKVFGENLTQISSLGFEVSENENGILYSEELKVYEEDGNYVVETMMPHMYKELIAPGTDVQIKDGEITINGVPVPNSSELLDAIGIRIPTDGIHSIEILRIKAFLPKHAGTKIVIPPGVVFKSGSDFDIDKMTTMFLNYYMKNGAPQKEQFYTNIEDWYKSNVDRTVRKFMHHYIDFKGLRAKLNRLQDMPIEADRMAVLFLNSFPGIANEEYTPEEVPENADQEEIDELIAQMDEIRKAVPEFMTEEKEMLYPKPFETWRNENPDKGVFDVQSIKALENGVIETSIKLLSDKGRREEHLNPVAIPNVENMKDSLLLMFEKSGFDIVQLGNVVNMHKETTIPYMAEVGRAYTQADKVLGIAAVTAKHHVQSQLAGTSLNMETVYELPDGNKIRPILWFNPQGVEAEMNKFHVEFNEMGEIANPFSTMGEIENVNGVKITEILSEFLNLAVDVVANPYLHILNITPGTAPAYFSLLRNGVPLETTALFFNQPIIREFIKKRDSRTSVARTSIKGKNGEQNQTDVDVYNETLKTFAPSSESKISAEEQYLTDEIMTAMIETPIEDLDDTQRTLQSQILDSFLAYIQVGEDITSVITAQSVDTKLIKSRAHARLVRSQYENVIGRNVFPGVEKILEKGVSYMSAMKDFTNMADDIFKNMFFTEKDQEESFKQDYNKFLNDQRLVDNFRQVYSEFVFSLTHPKNFKMSMDEKIRVLERLEQYYITTILQNINNDDGVALKDTAHASMYGSKTFAKLVSKIQNDESHPLNKNELLDFLIPYIEEDPKNTGQNDYVEPQFKAMNMWDDAILVDAYNALIEYDAINNTNIAYKVLQAAILQSGTINSPFSFLDRIPGEAYARLTNSILPNYKGNMEGLTPFSSTQGADEVFSLKFAENFIWNNYTVPPIRSQDDQDVAHHLFVKQNVKSEMGAVIGQKLFKIVNRGKSISSALEGRQDVVKLDAGNHKRLKGQMNTYSAPTGLEMDSRKTVSKEEC